MASPWNKFDSFVEAMAHKKHDLSVGGDTLQIALCNNLNAPIAGNSVLADLTEIAYTNLDARTVVVSASGQSGGLYTIKITDKLLTASGGAVDQFRYTVLFNPTALNNELIGWYDRGDGLDVTLQDGETYLVDFDDINGVFTLQ